MESFTEVYHLAEASGLKGFALNVLKSSLNEAIGEATGQYIENHADDLVAGALSERNQLRLQLLKAGVPDSEIEARLDRAAVEKIAQAAILGGLSGGLSSAITGAAGYRHYARTFKQYTHANAEYFTNVENGLRDLGYGQKEAHNLAMEIAQREFDTMMEAGETNYNPRRTEEVDQFERDAIPPTQEAEQTNKVQEPRRNPRSDEVDNLERTPIKQYEELVSTLENVDGTENFDGSVNSEAVSTLQHALAYADMAEKARDDGDTATAEDLLMRSNKAIEALDGILQRNGIDKGQFTFLNDVNAMHQIRDYMNRRNAQGPVQGQVGESETVPIPETAGTTAVDQREEQAQQRQGLGQAETETVLPENEGTTAQEQRDEQAQQRQGLGQAEAETVLPDNEGTTSQNQRDEQAQQRQGLGRVEEGTPEINPAETMETVNRGPGPLRPIQGPVNPFSADFQNKVNDDDRLRSQVTALNQAPKTANESTTIIASVFSTVDTIGDAISQSEGMTAARKLASKYDPQKAVNLLRSTLIEAAKQGYGNAETISAVETGALVDGQAAEVLAKIADFGATPNRVKNLINAAVQDLQTRGQEIQTAIRDGLISEIMYARTAEGALNGLFPYQEAERKARAKLNDAQKGVHTKWEQMVAANNHLNEVQGPYLEQPNNASFKADYEAAHKAMQGIAKELKYYQDGVENATLDYNAALDSLHTIQNQETTKLREEAAREADARMQAAREARQEKEAQRQARASAVVGKKGRAYLNSTQPIDFHYELVDSDGLIASNDTNGNVNPEYPSYLQPRDRTRADSTISINDMAANLNPELLGANPDIASGAPVVGPDYVVESGNGRTMALRLARQSNKPGAVQYNEMLRNRAAEFGFTPEQIRPNSILVRVRDTPVNRADFTRDANVQATSSMGATEQANVDAEKLTPEILALYDSTTSLDKDPLTQSRNANFLNAVVQQVPASERGAVIQADGKISENGVNRIRNALIQYAYGSNRLTTALAEATDNAAKNLSRVLSNIAPVISQYRSDIQEGRYTDVGLLDTITQAAEKFVSLKNSGQNVHEELDQFSMFDDLTEASKDMIRMFEDNVRSGKKIGRYLTDLIQNVMAQSDPNQIRLDGSGAMDASQLGSVMRGSFNQTTQNIEDESAARSSGQVRMDIQAARFNPQNVQTAPAQGPATRSIEQITKDFLGFLGVGDYVPTRKFNNLPRATRGYYERLARYVATRPDYAGDFYTTFHEIGHALAERLNLTGTRQMIAGLPAFFRTTYQNRELPGEAFAEFNRIYMQDENAARQFAGDTFVDTFERRLEEEGISDEYRRSIDDFRRFVNADANSQIGVVVRDASERANTPFRDRVRSFFARDIDVSSAAERINHAIREETGRNAVDYNLDIRKNKLMENFSDRQAFNILTRSLTDANGTRIGEGLNQRFERAGIRGQEDFDLLNRYLLAKHSFDRDARNLPVFSPTITAANRQAFIDDIERNHQNIVDGARAFEEFRHQFMQAMMVDTGFLTQQALDLFERLYPNYVPTYRYREGTDNGMGRSGYQVMNAVGSTEDIINPMDSFVSIVKRVVRMVNQNNTAMALHNAYQDIGGLGEFARQITSDRHREQINAEQMQQAVRDILENHVVGDMANTADDIMDMVMDAIETNNERWVDDNESHMQNSITVQLPDGNRVFYEVADPELYRLLSSAGPTAVSELTNTVGRVTRGMTAVTTGSNPLFAARNMMRDFQNSVNYGSWASNYATGIVKWLRAAYDVFSRSGQYEDYAALGGGGWTRVDPTQRKSATEIRNELIPGYDTSTAGRRVKKALDSISSLVTLERLNEVIEQTSRYAEYRYGKHDRTTAEGRHEAFLAAQDATVDFARSGYGTLLPVLKQVIPFFSAATQGVYRTGRMFTEGERSRLPARFAKTVINTALSSFLAAKILLGFGDDDEKFAFENMSDDLKSNHFFFPNFAPQVFGNRPLIRIPLAQDPLTYAVHGITTNAAWYGTTEQPMIDFMAIANTIIDNLNPASGGFITSALTDVQQNKTWYGSKIIPTRLEELNTNPSAQYTEDTPDVFIALGRATNMSPLNLQYLAEQYTGFVGQLLIPALSKDKHTGELGGWQAAITAAQNKFTTDPLISNSVVSVFYDNVDTLNDIVSTVDKGLPLNQLRRGLTRGEANKAYTDAQKLVGKDGILGKTKSKVTDWYNEIDKINANQSMSEESKYEATSAIRRKMIKECLKANEEVERYREKYIAGINIATAALYEGAYADSKKNKKKKK